ncbi:helix-turn-helix domain-containing protein [Sphingomonas sp. C8-2]|nr:helix-turn-helix domain-containing protein [Sphingomonas sp. C8-2]
MEAKLSVPHLTVRQGSRLSRKDAAEYLGMKPSTLKAWQRTGYGPRSVKVGSRRFYEIADLQAFSRGGHA